MKLLYKKERVIDHVKTGDAARALRNGKRKSLQDIADRMRVSKMFLSHLERGLRNWTPENARAFSEAVK